MPGVHPDHRRAVQQPQIAPDVRAEQPADESLHRVDHLVQVQDLRLRQLTLSEGQELAGEEHAAVGRLADLLRVGAARVILVQLAMENVPEATDRGENVVEVVRDPRGEPSHRVEPLGLAELLLAVVERGAGAGPLADVGRQHQTRPPPVQLQLVRHQLHVDHGAVFRWCRVKAASGRLVWWPIGGPGGSSSGRTSMMVMSRNSSREYP